MWKKVVGRRQSASAAQGVVGAGVDVLPRIEGMHLQPHAPGAAAYQGADFEQLEPDRIHMRLSPLGALQRQPPQRFNQRISQRRQVQPQMIALHLFRREAIGEQAFAAANSLMRFSISPRAQ